MYAHIYRRTYIRGVVFSSSGHTSLGGLRPSGGPQKHKTGAYVSKGSPVPLSVLLGFYVKVPCYNRVPFKGSVRVPQVSG